MKSPKKLHVLRLDVDSWRDSLYVQSVSKKMVFCGKTAITSFKFIQNAFWMSLKEVMAVFPLSSVFFRHPVCLDCRVDPQEGLFVGMGKLPVMKR